jgi:TPR repeat protein
LNAEEKVAWHAAAGLFLEKAGERDASLLAEHYRIGNQLTQAAHFYAKAAEQAHDAAALDAALTCIERGLACGVSMASQIR